MSKKLPQPSTFDAATSVLERLFHIDDALPNGTALRLELARKPAGNAAVIFSAIVQARAIDRLTKAVEMNTRAVLVASKIAPAVARAALADPTWEK